MLVGVLLAISASLSALAGDTEWPTVNDIYVGDTFKYPILGVPGHGMRPTQAAVGLQAVAEKKREMSRMSHDQLKHALEKDPIPVVAGPDGNFYIIDHHHQALAAHDIGRENAFYILKEDYSKLPDMDEFWRRMKGKKWVREFDHLGRPIPIPDGLPKTILGMLDDPYRSLAWFVRQAGGYRKSGVEFAEFLWADFFRTKFPISEVKREMKTTTKKAVVLAHTDAARGLPGWIDCKKVLVHEP
jgi:hypothetical protein